MNRTESNFKKFKNKPNSRVVCWRCKRGGRKGDKPLLKISELDYACDDCLVYGKPPIENASHIYYE